MEIQLSKRKKMMDKRQFLQGVPEYNKKHYREQIEAAEAGQAAENILPLHLFLPGFRLKSGNWTIEAHKFVLSRYKKKCARHMDIAGIKGVRRKQGLRMAIFTRLRPVDERVFDGDNLQTGFKYLRDHLKTRGWIWDDSPKWLVAEYVDRKPLDCESWGVSISVISMELKEDK